MKRLLNLKARSVVILYILIDIICVGAGMGLPLFCIILGFPLGWYIAERVSASAGNLYQKYYKIFRFSFLATLFTFLLMLIVWGRTIIMLFDPSADFSNFGHPFILYDPKISFIGWQILMMIISPFLQLLATIFGAFITLMRIEAKSHSPHSGKQK